jgi:hypothetical protein
MVLTMLQTSSRSCLWCLQCYRLPLGTAYANSQTLYITADLKQQNEISEDHSITFCKQYTWTCRLDAYKFISVLYIQMYISLSNRRIYVYSKTHIIYLTMTLVALTTFTKQYSVAFSPQAPLVDEI